MRRPENMTRSANPPQARAEQARGGFDALVLMYHAIPSGTGPCVSADPHYAVERRVFTQHLQLMQQLGFRPASVRELLQLDPEGSRASHVALTFDDGHESNFAAFAEIQRFGGSADFFINPGSVGSAGHLSWAQLREMDRQGASIQSHGLHHHALDELSPDGVTEALAVSRRRIEDELGRSCELFAPPFGRLSPGLVQRAQALGYRALCSSRVGLWKSRNAPEIPRYAVRAGTSGRQLAGCLHRSPWVLGAAQVRAAGLQTGKRLLGHGNFLKLRRLFVDDRSHT
jgi:peptidoglycan/xylan/chitin deacetylase (PgdA/CDA1 family)